MRLADRFGWSPTRKGHAHHLPFGEVVEELISWGWIDSSVRGIDDVSFKHLISPRKETSAWSAVNKAIVEKMRATGRMQPSGEAKIAAAKANGMWDFLDDVERLDVPADLAESLGKARPGWDDLPRSTRRGLLEKLKWAKNCPDARQTHCRMRRSRNPATARVNASA